MKLNKIAFVVWMVIFAHFWVTPFSQVLCQIKEKSKQNKRTIVPDSLIVSSERSIDEKTLAIFDSITVIHFHPTVQCSCCINVGNFAKKGLEEFYGKLYEDGRIIFKEYNIDEDSSTAKKYKIFWSALGFEKFSVEKNEFKEIESVWEFCEDEEKFFPNFKKEMDDFIMGGKKEKSKAKTTKQDVEKATGRSSK